MKNHFSRPTALSLGPAPAPAWPTQLGPAHHRLGRTHACADGHGGGRSVIFAAGESPAEWVPP